MGDSDIKKEVEKQKEPQNTDKTAKKKAMSDLGEKAGNSYCISLYFWWNSRWCDLPDHKSRKKEQHQKRC